MSPSRLPHLPLGRGFLWFTAYPLLTPCFSVTSTPAQAGMSQVWINRPFVLTTVTVGLFILSWWTSSDLTCCLLWVLHADRSHVLTSLAVCSGSRVLTSLLVCCASSILADPLVLTCLL